MALLLGGQYCAQTRLRFAQAFDWDDCPDSLQIDLDELVYFFSSKLAERGYLLVVDVDEINCVDSYVKFNSSLSTDKMRINETYWNVTL